MRIGLDLDNTLIRYDHVFTAEAKRAGLVSEDWFGSKQELRQELECRSDGEKDWQMLQGPVYGSRMSPAESYPRDTPIVFAETQSLRF